MVGINLTVWENHQARKNKNKTTTLRATTLKMIEKADSSSHKSQRVKALILSIEFLVFFCLVSMIFYFSGLIKSDEVVLNYGCHTDTIHFEIINNNDISIVSKLDQVGVFPVMVAVGDGIIDVIHHIQPSTTNFLTKKTINIKLIIGITEKGNPIEIRNLKLEELSKGKVPGLDKLLDITEDSDIKTLCLLQHHNESFRSFMFCLLELELIKIIEEMDQDDLKAELLLK